MAKQFAMIFGIILVILGVIGFFSNPVLGIFAVNPLHNIIHIVLGLVLVMGSRGMNPKGALKWVGIIAILIAVLSFLFAKDGMLFGLVTVDMAGNWIHLVLGIILFALSMGGNGNTAAPMNRPMTPGGQM